MDKWMGSKLLPSRTRFMVRDLIELRRSNWIPRRAQLQVRLTAHVPASAVNLVIDHTFLHMYKVSACESMTTMQNSMVQDLIGLRLSNSDSLQSSTAGETYITF